MHNEKTYKAAIVETHRKLQQELMNSSCKLYPILQKNINKVGDKRIRVAKIVIENTVDRQKVIKTVNAIVHEMDLHSHTFRNDDETIMNISIVVEEKTTWLTFCRDFQELVKEQGLWKTLKQ